MYQQAAAFFIPRGGLVTAPTGVPSPLDRGRRIVSNLRASNLTIYDPITIGDPRLWLPAPELEAVLRDLIVGLDLNGLPLRSRSKKVKEHVAAALGYPVPTSFKKTQPRFVGQNCDVYTQKATNFQVWNEELNPTRRYALLHVSPDHVVDAVKVVTGERLAELDTTGTLTQKYQARFIPGALNDVELLSPVDTPAVRAITGTSGAPGARSVDYPSVGAVRPIAEIFAALRTLAGQSFRDRGYTQDRNRGGDLHRLVCTALGYADFEDDGSCPDVKHQLLEIKLQTSPTIDLGLVCPNSNDPLDIPLVGTTQIRHADLRYLIVGARTDGATVTIERVYLVTGEHFFSHFPQFGGKVLNKKLQMHLPARFFDD